MEEGEEEEEQSELEKKIIDAFEVFDHGGDKAVDVREVGTIIRSLGCCPTEAEIQEIIAEVEDQETSGSVPLERFLPVMMLIIQENRLQPASPEKLLEAFLTLDPENKGYLSKDDISKAMMEEGEPFTQEELDEMLAIAVDGETGRIPYEYYINQLMGPSIIGPHYSEDFEVADNSEVLYVAGNVSHSDCRKKRKIAPKKLLTTMLVIPSQINEEYIIRKISSSATDSSRSTMPAVRGTTVCNLEAGTVLHNFGQGTAILIYLTSALYSCFILITNTLELMKEKRVAGRY